MTICHVEGKVAKCLTAYFRTRSETMSESQGTVIQEQAIEYRAFMPGVRICSGS